MAQAKRYPSSKILKAVSSSTRLQVLTLLYEKGPQSYTDIMNTLKMNPSRDAGKFAYHLKALIKADLIEPDTDTKKYKITEFGRLVLGLTEEIEKQTQKRKKMLVRTSKLSIEEFDRNRIISSLIKEASVPTELAQKVAREAENRLKQFETKYLTAPLIREIVNTILVEKGLEEYRHKLTRVGLPVHDVAQLIETARQNGQNIEAVHRQAGDAVIEEYTLLNVLPRDIADAHISGALHINNLGSWILKPQKIMHDLRFFLKNGLRIRENKSYLTEFSPPKDFASALSMILNIVRLASTEFSGQQTFDYFNIFLAPYAKGLGKDRLKEELRQFLFNLNQGLLKEGKPVETTIGLELITPEFLADNAAVAPGTHSSGAYSEFVDESQLIANTFLEASLEESRRKPFLNPGIVVKIRSNALRDQQVKTVLYLAHQLAAEYGLPCFANLCKSSQIYVSYDVTGQRLGTEWRREWEVDTLRTGCLDSALINLPRLAYNADCNQGKFFEFLSEQLEMVARALEIKYQIMKHYMRGGALPFSIQNVNGDSYSHLENMTRAVGFVGLNEAVQCLLNQPIFEDEKALGLAEKIVGYVHQFAQKNSKKPETRLVPAMVSNSDAAHRLAELDVERYGLGKVQIRGSRENPYYTDLTALPLDVEIPLEKRIFFEGKFHQLCFGAHLAVLNLPNKETTPEELLTVTSQIVNDSDVGLYAYSRELVYCSRCNHVSYGIPSKCSFCESTSTLTYFRRNSSKYA